MKRTGEILVVLLLQLLLALLISFRESSLLLILGLLSLNVVLAALLALEPYWKIGAWLLCLMSIEVSLYILNLLVFERLLIGSGRFTLLVIFAGVLVAYLAHRLRIKESHYQPEDDFMFEAPAEENKEPLTNAAVKEEPKPAEKEEKKLEVKTFLATKNDMIHVEGCSTIKKSDDTRVIGSEKYARSKKFTPCKVCKPFG